MRRPPRSTLFPYTPLCRSLALGDGPLRRAEPAGAAPADRGGRAAPPLLARDHGCRLQGDAGALRRARRPEPPVPQRSEEHTSELQSRQYLVCRLLLEKKKN